MTTATPRTLERWHLPFLIALWTIPAAILSHFRITDGFLYITASFAEASIHQGGMSFETLAGYNYGRQDFFPNYPMILATLSHATGLDMTRIIFLPVGGPILGLATYYAARQFTDDWRIASLLSIFAVTDFTLAHHYNTFAYSWAFPLYLMFLVQLRELLQRYQTRRLAVVILLFAGTMLMHYAVALWMLVGAVVFSAVQWRQRARGAAAGGITAGLAILLSILFLTYNRVFYDLWLPKVTRQSAFDQSLEVFLQKVQSYLAGTNQIQEIHAFPNAFGTAFSATRVLEYLVLMGGLALGVFLLWRARRRAPEAGARVSFAGFLPLVVVATTVSEVAAYSAHGWVPVKYVVLAFPLLVAALLLRSGERNRKVAVGIVAALTALSVAGFLMVAQKSEAGATASDAPVGEAAAWLREGRTAQPSILSDLETSGRVLLAWAPHGALFRPVYYDDALYESVVNGSAPDARMSRLHYVMFDEVAGAHGSAVHGVAERNYEPLGPYDDAIRANPRLVAIYDNGQVWIARPTVQTSV